MRIMRCESNAASVRELVLLSESSGLHVLILSFPAVSNMTLAELRFAYYFAKESFLSKTNLSEKKSNEALLFLSCQTNFTSAVMKIGAKNPSDFVLVMEENAFDPKFRKALKIARAKKIKLPEWGKKIGHYTQGELAVERMALARNKN